MNPPLQVPWQHNVRILKCADGTYIKPCPRCTHAFGEHNMLGRCEVCERNGADCEVRMHEAWPDLVPYDLQTHTA